MTLRAGGNVIELKSSELLRKIFESIVDITSLDSNTRTYDGDEIESIIKTSLPLYEKDRTVVLGMDLYRYSKMDPYEQSLIPFVLDSVRISTISDLVKGCPFVFQKWKSNPSEELRKRMINTGDGCFIIFDNQVEALCFLIVCQSRVVLFNSNKFLPKVRSFVGEITIRYSITCDSVYHYDNNYYGKGIVKNARIISKDRLNRVLIDKATQSWFVERFAGIENVVNFELSQIKTFPEFSGYEPCSNEDTFIFVEKEKYPREGIKNVQCSQLENIKEKDDEYSVYSLYLQVNLGFIQESKTHFFNFSIGNTNTVGI